MAVPLLLTTLLAVGSDSRLSRVDLDGASYFVDQAVDARAGDSAPLVFILHGTNTGAIDIIKFWKGLTFGLPCTLVAPRGSGPGWNDGDLATLARVLADVQANVPHDPDRVLLTGHSAGGAMAMHLLYNESFPATAALVTACYVPPTVTADGLRSRSDVPLFYAVGRHDINRQRMREGLVLLQTNAVRVTMRTPDIGHVLDVATTQSGLGWFEDRCRAAVETDIARARSNPGVGAEFVAPLVKLESVVRHRRYHFPDQVARAAELVERLQLTGRRQLLLAGGHETAERYATARGVLLEVEERYGVSSLAGEAERRRFELERRPELAEVLRLERRTEDERDANDRWRRVETAIADGRIDDADSECRALIAGHPRTAAAAKARVRLDALRKPEDPS